MNFKSLQNVRWPAAGLVPLKLKILMTTYFLSCILFYLCNHYLLSYFAILIVYLRLKGYISLFTLLCFVFVFNIFLWSLHWTRYVFVHSEATGRSSKNSCSTSVLSQLKHMMPVHFSIRYHLRFEQNIYYVRPFI